MNFSSIVQLACVMLMMPFAYNTSSMSPTDVASFSEETYFPRISRTVPADKAVKDQLSQYRFPRNSQVLVSSNSSYDGSGCSPFKKLRNSPVSPKTIDVHSPTSGIRERRISVHRRSIPVSLSSAESIFDKQIQSTDSERSVSFESGPNESPNLSTKKDSYFGNKLNTKKSVEFIPEPIIDLDINSKILRPRVGSGVSEFEYLSFQGHKIAEETDTEIEEDSTEALDLEEVVSLVDFLKECEIEKKMEPINEPESTERGGSEQVNKNMFCPFSWFTYNIGVGK